MSAAPPTIPGVVIRDLCVSIADGGDCVADLGVLRGREDLFGTVAEVVPLPVEL